MYFRAKNQYRATANTTHILRMYFAKRRKLFELIE